MLQGADLGRETDEVEEILLETEWCVTTVPMQASARFDDRCPVRSANDINISKESADRIVALFLG